MRQHILGNELIQLPTHFNAFVKEQQATNNAQRKFHEEQRVINAEQRTTNADLRSVNQQLLTMINKLNVAAGELRGDLTYRACKDHIFVIT